MTDKERLDALTMNLELLYRDTQEMREAQKLNAEENAKAMTDLRQMIEENTKGIAQSRLEGQAQRERIDLLVHSVDSLLAVAQAHETRISKLERKSA